jgi:hypothetical protein
MFASGGCRGCRENHPYVPYAIDVDAMTQRQLDGSAPPASGVADAAADHFAARTATLAPPGLGQWTLDGVTLIAPAGNVFVAGILGEFERDGAKAAFAVVRRAAGDDPGGLAYYRVSEGTAVNAAVDVVAPPDLVAPEADCTSAARLLAVGPRSVLVELGTRCPRAMIGRGSRRWIAVVAVKGARPVVRLAVALASDAPEVRVDGEAIDLDGDGVEDVSLRVTLDDAASPSRSSLPVVASVAWLDRPAGLSQNVAVTEASFASLAGSALARGGRAKDASSVSGITAQIRALYRALCAEGGAPKLTAVGGAGTISCGGARALEETGLADVRAFATMGDGLRAALALDRVGRAPATKTAARIAEAGTWVLKASPVVLARSVRAVAAVPNVPSGRIPALGPLAFVPSGKLIVCTKAGAAIVNPENGDEAAAEDVAVWPSAVTSPDLATRWTDVVDPCDGSPLHAKFTSGPHEDGADVALPVPAPLGAGCSLGRKTEFRLVPISWDPTGLQALVDGVPVLVYANLTGASPLNAFVDSPARRGTPRSPDGSALVVATGSGLVVRAGGRDRVFRAPELDGTYEEQQDCTVSNDQVHVACIQAGKVWVGIWPFASDSDMPPSNRGSPTSNRDMPSNKPGSP